MGVDVLNPVRPECIDIYELKETQSAKIIFRGGISTQRPLPYGTPDILRAEIDQVVTAMSVGGGYITSPAQGIQSDVAIDSILALIERATSYTRRQA